MKQPSLRLDFYKYNAEAPEVPLSEYVHAEARRALEILKTIVADGSNKKALADLEELLRRVASRAERDRKK